MKHRQEFAEADSAIYFKDPFSLENSCNSKWRTWVEFIFVTEWMSDQTDREKRLIDKRQDSEKEATMVREETLRL